jgi:hypothetical protein
MLGQKSAMAWYFQNSELVYLFWFIPTANFGLFISIEFVTEFFTIFVSNNFIYRLVQLVLARCSEARGLLVHALTLPLLLSRLLSTSVTTTTAHRALRGG